MHTKDKLAAAMRQAKLPLMAAAADKGHYHDFLSPLEFPEIELCEELLLVGTPAALALRDRVFEGEFDATVEESEAWMASQAGQAALRRLAG